MKSILLCIVYYFVQQIIYMLLITFDYLIYEVLAWDIMELRNPYFLILLLIADSNKKICVNYYNRYALKELGTLNMSCYYPNSFLSTGIDILSFGYDSYRESLFRLSFGKKLSNKWSLGISIQYSLLQTGNVGK